jgi:glycosyltransferase involved in cell wall biosynthesis
MKIYWYWPHPHRAASPLCLAVLRPGDQLTVHALPSLAGESFGAIEEYEVVRDLPDPSRGGRGIVARSTRPITLTIERSQARMRVVRRGYDVAHIGNLVYQTDWADLRRLRRRVPLVCDVHDVRPHRRALPAALETVLLKETYRAGGHLIVLHDVLKDEMVSEFGIDPERVHVVPHVLDTGAARDPSHAPPERPVFLLFGTLRTNKGVGVLADALTALGDELNADVVIAGAGDAETTTMLNDRLGRLDNVTLEFGRVSPERKRQLFSGAAWVLLPYTEFHSQSGILADAYTYRLPIIASDVGAIGPTVKADGTGIVVTPGDATELADALLRAARSDRDAFAAALDTAAQRHDVSVVGPRLRSIYELAATNP